MADNPNRYGFTYVGGMGFQSGVGAPSPIEAFVASAYQAAPGAVNVDLNPGDPVTKLASGYYQLAAAGGSAKIDGIITSINRYYDGTVMRFGPVLPGATTYGTNFARISSVMIVPPIGHLWECVADDATTFTTFATYLAALNSNCDHAFAGDATQKKAFPRIDISTNAVTATLQWNLVGLPRREETDYSGLYVPLLVTANLVGQAPVQTTGL